MSEFVRPRNLGTTKYVMTTQERDTLLAIKNMLLTNDDVRKRWDYSHIMMSAGIFHDGSAYSPEVRARIPRCGTVGCAIGHARELKIIPDWPSHVVWPNICREDIDDIFWDDHARKDDLHLDDRYDYIGLRITPETVVARIDRVLDKYTVQE